MATALPALQLQLFDSLPPSPFVDVHARTRSKPLTLTLDRHRAALQCLLQGPVPLAQIARAAGATDEQKLVDELREIGLDIQTVTVPSPGNGGDADFVTVYRLTRRDIRKVFQYVKKQERKND
jgi:hypothetical protein